MVYIYIGYYVVEGVVQAGLRCAVTLIIVGTGSFSCTAVRVCWAERPRVWVILGSRLGSVVEWADERQLVCNRSRRRCIRSRWPSRLGPRKSCRPAPRRSGLLDRPSGNRLLRPWFCCRSRICNDTNVSNTKNKTYILRTTMIQYAPRQGNNVFQPSSCSPPSPPPIPAIK